MDEMFSNSEVKDLNKATVDAGAESVKRCASPVFKCISNTKAIRGNNLDSSDYDISSYQINQLAKSKTLSKHDSEANEWVLPFSPIFSPIPISSTTQFQPPSIHSLGTVAKMIDKSCKNKINSFLHINKDSTKSCGLFESLGMSDKDVSWVSSMASPPPKRVPGSEFNTVEKATFFPEEKFQNIQPRALFSPNLDDDFDCHPISFGSESENGDSDDDDTNAYQSNIRLSDVCATLRQLEVKSLDQASDHSKENMILQENGVLSPVIRTKKNKPESAKKKKKGGLVVSPDNEQKYEFTVGQNRVVKCEFKSDDGSNFIGDDSFQSMSFSCIDELCKTLVSERSTSSIIPNSNDCDKTLSNISTIISKTDIPKIFYDSKATADVCEVSSISDLHSYAKALEKEDMCISVGSKINQAFTGKGIMRFDILNKDAAKIDETNQLQSEEFLDENGLESDKKFEKVNDETMGWEKMKQYLSESQLNVSDGEMFRTVENLEKTLASQESKELAKSSMVQEAESLLCQNLGGPSSFRTDSGAAKELGDTMTSEYCENGIEICRVDIGAVPMMAFTNVLGSKISISKKALDRAREILRECDEDIKYEGTPEECTEFIQTSEKITQKEAPARRTDSAGEGLTKEVRVVADALGEANASASEYEHLESVCLENPCIAKSKENVQETFMRGFMTGSGKRINVSAKALERAKTILSECDQVSEAVKKDITISKRFSTGCEKKIQVSAKAFEKARALMKECNESLERVSEGSFMEDFSVSSEKKLEVSGLPLESVKSHLEDYEEGSNNKHPCSADSEKTASISGAYVKAKSPMPNCEHEFGGNSSEGTTIRREDIYQTFDNSERVKLNAQIFEENQENATFGFSTALGNKVTVSSKALEKAKLLWCESQESLMEVNPRRAVSREPPSMDSSSTHIKHQKTSESETNLAKASDGNRNKSLAEDPGNAHVGDSIKPPTKSGLQASRVEKKDIYGMEGAGEWDEIIPRWLHVYSTSPSVASDGTQISASVVLEEGNSSRPTTEYIVKSPVLGEGDRFHGKRKRRKLEFEQNSQTGFTVPYKRVSYPPIGGAKRASGLPIDFSVPFKRVKFVEELMTASSDAREERARKRNEQEKAIKEKHRVKPSQGLHLRRKCLEKQISWLEAVGGSAPEMHSDELLKTMGVNEEVLSVSITNAASFSFKGEDFFGPSCEKNTEGFPAGDDCILILDDENRVGVQEFRRAFLASPGVQPNLVPDGWIENHFKWIVWKLAHYERSFPRYFAGSCLTPNNVMLQLKYRYDREIDKNERSAVKKILERDETSTKRLVLCICGIEKTGVNISSQYELSLTDGWYSFPARTDTAMAKLISEGKLCVGMKLMIHGAILVNCEQGIAPLEITKDVHLKISTNSTRRVKWDTKLGFQRNPQSFPISLNSVLPQGGTISRIDVIIVRVYPVLYMEKTPDGHHVTRNSRSEEKADAEYRRIQEQKMETICDEVRLEMRKAANLENKTGRDCLSSLKQIEDKGELMDSGSDPSNFQELMSADQRKFLENFQSDQSDRLSRELADRVEKKLKNENLRRRNVSEFFRAKIVDFRKPDYNNPAVLSVWHPNEDLVTLLSEGKVISLMNVTTGNSSRACNPLQISTTRQTQYTPICRSIKYPTRKVTPLKDVSSKACPAFEEVDLVGMVVFVKDISYGSRLSQVVYLTDMKMNFAGIVFWGNCKNYGWENVLRIRCVVACSNLQWKRNYSPQDVPSLYVNENSVFTENPKQSYMKEEMLKLKQSTPQDVTAFLSKCEEVLTARLEESKWRGNRSRNSSADDSIPRGIQSTKARANGFESKPTASSTPIKPFSGGLSADEAEPSPVQKRIEKLQSYGEPPPLVPLIMKNSEKRKFRKKSAISRTYQ